MNNNTKGNPKHQYQEGKPQPSEAVKAEEAGRWTPKALIGGELLPVAATREHSPWRSLFFFSAVASTPSAVRPGEMKWRRIAILATLQAQLPATGRAGSGFARSCRKALLRKGCDISVVDSPPFW